MFQDIITTLLFAFMVLEGCGNPNYYPVARPAADEEAEYDSVDPIKPSNDTPSETPARLTKCTTSTDCLAYNQWCTGNLCEPLPTKDILLTIEWVDTKIDWDLALVRYRPCGTFATPPPKHLLDSNRKFIRCKNDQDCQQNGLNGYCWEFGACMERARTESDDDTVFPDNRRTDFGAQYAMDATHGTTEEQDIIQWTPTKSGRYRVVARYFSSYDPEAPPFTGEDSLAMVTVAIGGKICPLTTHSDQFSVALPFVHAARVFDIVVPADGNVTCANVQPLSHHQQISEDIMPEDIWVNGQVSSSVKAASYKMDPLDVEQPRSIWCEKFDDPDCIRQECAVGQ